MVIVNVCGGLVSTPTEAVPALLSARTVTVATPSARMLGS